MLTRDYDGMRAYRQSKLAQIMFTFDLAHELDGSGVTVNALHPATFMATKMVTEFGAPLTTVAQGADAIMKLAVSPELEGRSGLFFNSQNEAKANEQAYDADGAGATQDAEPRAGGLGAVSGGALRHCGRDRRRISQPHGRTSG